MNEFLSLSLMGMGGGFGTGSGFDIVALLTFVTAAVFYLIVPVIGYSSARRGGFIAALYLLIGYGALSLVQTIVMWTQMASMGGGMGRADVGQYIMAFTVVKMMIYLGALVMFVSGLIALRPRNREVPNSAE